MKPLSIKGFATLKSDAAVAIGSLYSDALPSPDGHAMVDFDVRAHLGRKGTSFYDRATALAVVTVGAALRDAGIEVDDSCRARIGVALGTTVGSFKSTSDYSMETLVQPKPYLVNPVLFPNTVMNCAAGQVAIRYGLRGVNATIAGGQMALLNALRYADNAINQGYADTMLVGAVEEFTPHRAWMTALRDPSVQTGEAAAVFVIGTGPGLAEVLAVATGYGSEDACVERALRRAAIGPDDISVRSQELEVVRRFGDCGAATSAVALAAVLELHQAEPARDGQISLLTSRTADGAVGAAIVRGWSRVGSDRG